MTSNEAQRNSYQRAALIVVLIYCVVYGALVIAGQGYPYGLDNNESYSSWWHARSLYENGVSQTKGLTDEVFSTQAAASPYIHSHQGNFPRLFTFLLYAAGVRSIESQIWITTFTVGMAAILLAFRVLAAMGGVGFAVAGCLVMQTNYLLFAQWQVSLYNVWHAVLFFSSLLCVQAADAPRRCVWFVLATLNFAALFYWEYVFAAFVSLLCALTAAHLHWRRWKRLGTLAGCMALGAALAGGTLLLQLIAYMGWPAVLEDIRLTLTARNVAADPELLARVSDFYREHQIIFWHNFFDAAPYRNASAFWQTFTLHHLGYYSRPIVVAVLPAAAALVVGTLRNWTIQRASVPPKVATTFASLALLGLAFAGTRWALEAPMDEIGSGGEWTNASAVWILAGGTTLITGIGLWLFASHDTSRHDRVVLWICFALVAYAAVYRIFTGYVLSGYLFRLVPLLVFVTDAIAAAVVIQVLDVARHASAQLGRRAGFVLTLLCCIWLGLLGWQWTQLQREGVALAPPNAYNFLTELDHRDYRGRSLVSNTYPAPMAARTQAWGYADPVLMSGKLSVADDGFRTENDLKYLWFADRDRNPAYLRPDLAVAVVQAVNPVAARQIAEERQAAVARGNVIAITGLSRRVRDPLQPFLQHRLLFASERAEIMQLDWDFPPFLHRNESEVSRLAAKLDFRQRLSLSVYAATARRNWRVAWELPEDAQNGSLPFSVWGDDKPVELASAPAGTVIHADRLTIVVRKGNPESPPFKLTVNGVAAVLKPAEFSRDLTIRRDVTAPYGQHTHVPLFAPGLHVSTTIDGAGGQQTARLSLQYAHQDGKPQSRTVLRLFGEEEAGAWTQIDEITLLGIRMLPVRLTEFRRSNPDTVLEHQRAAKLGDGRSYEQWLGDHLDAHPEESIRPGVVADVRCTSDSRTGATDIILPVPRNHYRQMYYSVAPSTRTKEGLEYLGLPFDAQTVGSVEAKITAEASDAALPFGAVRLNVRFPKNRWPQSEPLLVTGSNEAGDIVYVIYHDAHHIRLGFDHWFVGGPLTAPIRIDPDAEHELVIAMGSLFPPEGDLVFANGAEPAARELKRRIRIQLNGQTVMDAPAQAYESAPQQVEIGRNRIGATSCGPEFTGTIVSVERFWPGRE